MIAISRSMAARSITDVPPNLQTIILQTGGLRPRRPPLRAHLRGPLKPRAVRAARSLPLARSQKLLRVHQLCIEHGCARRAANRVVPEGHELVREYGAGPHPADGHRHAVAEIHIESR